MLERLRETYNCLAKGHMIKEGPALLEKRWSVHQNPAPNQEPYHKGMRRDIKREYRPLVRDLNFQVIELIELILSTERVELIHIWLVAILVIYALTKYS